MGTYEAEEGALESVPKEARMWGMWCHLGALAGFIGIPFGNILVPAVIWMMKRDSHPFVDAQGKESLNFQICLLIYCIIAGLLCLIVIGLIILPVLIIGGLVLTIIAGIKANDGIPYRYPYIFRLLD